MVVSISSVIARIKNVLTQTMDLRWHLDSG